MEPRASDFSSPGDRALFCRPRNIMVSRPGSGVMLPHSGNCSLSFPPLIKELTIQPQEGGQLPCPGSAGERKGTEGRTKVMCSSDMGQDETHRLGRGRQEPDPAASRSILSNKPCHIAPSISTLWGLWSLGARTPGRTSLYQSARFHGATVQVSIEWVLPVPSANSDMRY